MKKLLKNKIILGLTGDKNEEWQGKIDEINIYNIKTIGLFLSRLTKTQRKKIYIALEESCIEKIPLIHIRNDMDKAELKYLCNKYDNPFLTIHETSFNYLDKWKGYHNKMYLELNFNDSLEGELDLNKIGGFCIDLAHFKASHDLWTKEFDYILENRNHKGAFRCNHLSGYSIKDKVDRHSIKKLSDFDYFMDLPEFIFGEVMALEVENSLAEQMKFKKYLEDLKL